MKILIAADMEGVAGVVHWDQVSPGHEEYPSFRELMTQEVNAASRGAFEAGAESVVVADGHAHGRNLIIDRLDPRVRLNSGVPAPFSMVQGISADTDGAMFIGYHARVGTPNAILDHTWSSSRIANLWLNGTLMGETGVNAAVCGHFGVPVIMVSGDQTVCAEASELLGAIETAVVKQAVGRMAAECLSPEMAREAIFEAALRAVKRLKAGQGPEPLRLDPPITLSVELAHSEMADRAALLPGTQRSKGRRVAYTADDVLTIYRALRTIVSLA